jgi:hypothetical protein
MNTFTTTDEALAVLGNHTQKFIFPFEHQPATFDIFLRTAIQGNTFRGLHHVNGGAAYRFRAWFDSVSDEYIERVGQVDNREDYRNILDDFTRRLGTYWLNYSNIRMVEGVAYKLLNLVSKHLVIYRYVCEDIRYSIDVPLDAYTLRPISGIINSIASSYPFRVKIPANASMSCVNHRDMYVHIQNYLVSLYDTINTRVNARSFPLMYDFWAWNDNH